jgi:hypothetical protein
MSSFFAHPDHKDQTTDGWYSVIDSINGAAMLNMLQNYHYSEDNETQLSGNEGTFISFIWTTLVSIAKMTFEVN